MTVLGLTHCQQNADMATVYTFRSMLSNQVNWVLFGSSAHGFITIQVGPFSALKQTKKKSEQFKQD